MGAEGGDTEPRQEREQRPPFVEEENYILYRERNKFVGYRDEAIPERTKVIDKFDGKIIRIGRAPYNPTYEEPPDKWYISIQFRNEKGFLTSVTLEWKTDDGWYAGGTMPAGKAPYWIGHREKLP